MREGESVLKLRTGGSKGEGKGEGEKKKETEILEI